MKEELPLPECAYEKIIDFIRFHVRQSKADGVITGLSGGVDSAVVTKLCVSALGKEHVFSLLLFDKDAKKADVQDATEFAKSLGIRLKNINIDKIISSFIPDCGLKDIKTMGNLKARTRMAILYYYANSMNYLVVGSGNKSEILTGYFTKYGDGGADLLPIGDLYKTQVWKLAAKIGIPEKIIKKVPSAGLWKGQTDEKELGIRYKTLDKILYALDSGLKKEDIAKELKIGLKDIESVRKRIECSKHKRSMPPIPKMM